MEFCFQLCLSLQLTQQGKVNTIALDADLQNVTGDMIIFDRMQNSLAYTMFVLNDYQSDRVILNGKNVFGVFLLSYGLRIRGCDYFRNGLIVF